ncbi:hypothetical protein ASPZODRAFT_142601 [Penicilliopsis zonata CBS 506.65]|uniref:FAD dependent oxidoreductase domain-containing protein n=1 Tax=Penicilliopsis zonata CBS 506.65 TaxID=1073090 RepID=A0A1L9SI45_9EURO|nr:hypothetical protein ASPZODRAFT_142601 [Penicilliopsis zonata CBS 506.65]OJJ46807.1 hypothetical protein ASPZODRAFT_142601 [Penicilliopsis zonata CBS 506.65]
MGKFKPVVIVGAGVLGLTTASVLQDKYPGIQITIVAADVPLVPPVAERERPSPDYASMWAGAHLRPTPGADRQLGDEHFLARRTAAVMKSLARSNPESGVQEVDGREVMEYLPEDKQRLKTGDSYVGADDQFRILEAHEIEAGGVWGCEYKTWIVNVHVYCRWLLTNFIRRGGNVVQRRLNSLDEAFDPSLFPSSPSSSPSSSWLVVNCSGRNFDTDEKTNVIRGQTVLVKNTYHKTATRHNKDDTWSFLIPRPLGGGTIVGGTKQHGDWGTEIRPQETAEILAAAAKYWPDFVSKVEDFEVVMVNVGRRPWREGGMRIEREELGKGRVVVHGYGAGARGYELSWGAAERIAGLVDAGVVSAKL